MKSVGLRALIGFTLLLAGSVSLGACNLSVDDAAGNFTPNRPNRLTVVTESPMPTAGFWEGTPRHPTGGLEYGMAVEMAQRLGLEGVDIHTESFSRIVSGELGGADVAMALLTPTPDREKVLDFTTPYVESPPVLVVRDGTRIPDVHTAQGMQFAVGRGTTFEEITTNEIRPDSAPLTFENRNRELNAVRRGKADVAMFDLPAAMAIVNQDKRLSIAARLAQTEPIAVALPKGSSNVDAVGSALRAMGADGSIDQLAEDSLGGSITDAKDNTPLLRVETR